MTDLIKRLIASGELVLYHDYRSRSLRDWSGQGNDGVAVNTPKWGGGNIRLDDLSRQHVSVASAAELNFTAFTFLMLTNQWVNLVTGTTTIGQNNLYTRYANPLGYDFNIVRDILGGNDAFHVIDSGGTNRFLLYNSAGKKLIAIDGANNAICKLYADGIFINNFSGANGTFNSYGTGGLTIGDTTPFSGASFVLPRIGIQAALIINRQLTAIEHAQIYSELINMSWESKPGKHAWRNTRPVNVSASTVAQYEMIARGTTVADVSGNGRNGTLQNCSWNHTQTPIGKAIYFHERFDNGVVTGLAPRLNTNFTETTLNPVSDNISFCCWQKHGALSPVNGVMNFIVGKGNSAVAQYILDGGLYYWASTNQIIYSSYTGGAYEVLSGPVLLKNNYHQIGWTKDVATKLVTLYIDGEAYSPTLTYTTIAVTGAGTPWVIGHRQDGDSQIRSFNGEILAPQFIKAVQDATWWKEQYRAGARAVQYQMGNGIETSLVTSEGGTVGAYLSNSRWRFADGTARYKIGIEQINGQWLKTIESVTAGYLYAPIEDMLGNDAPNSSYGTWEWWQYKTDAGTVELSVVGTRNTAPGAGNYTMIATATEAAQLSEDGVGPVFTIPATFTHSVWQKVKLTRSYAGRWRLYVNDVLITTATDNTSYTTTNWLLYLSAGCKIAGLTKYLGDVSV